MVNFGFFVFLFGFFCFLVFSLIPISPAFLLLDNHYLLFKHKSLVLPRSLPRHPFMTSCSSETFLCAVSANFYRILTSLYYNCSLGVCPAPLNSSLLGTMDRHFYCCEPRAQQLTDRRIGSRQKKLV